MMKSHALSPLGNGTSVNRLIPAELQRATEIIIGVGLLVHRIGDPGHIGERVVEECNQVPPSAPAGQQEGLKHSSASAAARRGVRFHRASATALLQPGHPQCYATLHPIASVTVLRPECKLIAAETARAE